MHRVTEFAPGLTIGGSASRRGHVALALADSDADYADALADWEHVAVYYAAIRSEGSGRVIALPGFRSPLVTYQLTEGDMSRLARALVHLGEVLLAAGATELYPSVTGGGRRPRSRRSRAVVGRAHAQPREPDDGAPHVDACASARTGRAPGADSFGRVWGFDNLRVNDASLLPEAPGVNPQGPIMAVVARNTDQFLADDVVAAAPRAERVDRGVDRERGEHHERRLRGRAEPGARVGDRATVITTTTHGREQRVQRRRVLAGRAAARPRPGSTTAPAAQKL